MKQSVLDYFDKFIPKGGVALQIGDDGGGYTPEIARRLGEGGQLVVFAKDAGIARDVGEAMKYRDVADTRPSSEVYCVDIDLKDRELDDFELSELHFIKIGRLCNPATIFYGMPELLKKFKPIILFATPREWPAWIKNTSVRDLRNIGYKCFILNDGALLELPEGNFPKEEMVAVYCGE